MPDDDAYTIVDWIDQNDPEQRLYIWEIGEWRDSVNADPDVSEDDDDEEATEWDEMSSWGLDSSEDPGDYMDYEFEEDENEADEAGDSGEE